MEELISLRSNDDLEEFKVHRYMAFCHLDRRIYPSYLFQAMGCCGEHEIQLIVIHHDHSTQKDDVCMLVNKVPMM